MAVSSPSVRRTSNAYTPTSPPHEKLWRVMDFTKFQTMLCGGLWFSRLDTFCDPLEGSLPAQNRLGLLAKLRVQDAAWVEREYDRAVLRSYALCWQISDSDPTTYLWNEFGNPDTGIAVGTTRTRLVNALRSISGPQGPEGPGGPVYFGAVTYLDHHAASIPEGNVLEATFAVQDKFSREREARALIHTYGTAAYDHLFDKRGRRGPLVEHVFGAESPGGGHELTGAAAGGRAIVVEMAPQAVISEIIPDRRLRLSGRWQLLVMATRAGLAARVRCRRRRDQALRLLARTYVFFTGADARPIAG